MVNRILWARIEERPIDEESTKILKKILERYWYYLPDHFEDILITLAPFIGAFSVEFNTSEKEVYHVDFHTPLAEELEVGIQAYKDLDFLLEELNLVPALYKAGTVTKYSSSLEAFKAFKEEGGLLELAPKEG